MSQIRQIKDWRLSGSLGTAYERLLASIGTDEFGANVRDSVLSWSKGVRRIYLFEATGRLETSLQYYFGEPGLVSLFPDYLKSYLRLDPVCDAYLAAPAFSDIVLQIVRPGDIRSPGFRQRVFDDAGIIERASVIQRGPDSWRAISVARHVTQGCFSEGELDALLDLACLVLPMVPLHRSRGNGQQALSVSQLEERFRNRYENLTLRECQVCARAVIGMSVEATAQDLGIAKTSVVTYRHRAYQRLNVASPFELCRLVTH